jgi:hypothetical protein
MKPVVQGKRHVDAARAAEYLDMTVERLLHHAGNGEINDALLVAEGWFFTRQGLDAFKVWLNSRVPRAA